MLWLSAPRKILMRLNAPIPALLAVAVLYFFPVGSLAKPAHHHAHKTTVAAAHHPGHHKPTTSRSHSAHHHTRHAQASVVGIVRHNSPSPHLPSVHEAVATPVILPTL